ncbi:hypothetical protein ACFLUX_02275 [Chloroflexota bacterium]
MSAVLWTVSGRRHRKVAAIGFEPATIVKVKRMWNYITRRLKNFTKKWEHINYDYNI